MTLQSDEPTVRHLIGRFDLSSPGGTLVPVARGAMGRVWRLDLATAAPDEQPSRYSVKEFLWGAEPDAERHARAEAEFRQAAVSAGVRAQQSYPNRDGEYVERLPARLGGAVVRLCSWVDGRTIQLSDARRAEYLGRTLGTLHALGHPTDTIPDPYFTTPPPMSRWSEVLDRAAAPSDFAAHIARTLATKLRTIEALTALVDTAPQTDLICSHRDVQPLNVIVRAQTGEYTLIDWDEVGPVSPKRELAAQLCTWHIRDGAVDERAIDTTLRAYLAAGGTAVPTSLDAFSLRLANDLNYLADELSSALDPGEPEDIRSFARREAERFLSWLPTVEQLRAVLSAVEEAV